MTVGLLLTIIFLVLRYGVHAIDWPLWQCFLPFIIEGSVELVFFLAVITGIAGSGRSTTRSNRRRR